MGDVGEPTPAAGAPLAHAPPTRAGEVVAPRGSLTWPTVIGVLCIVFGALGVMYALMGIAQSVMFYFASEAMRQEAGGVLPGSPDALARAALFCAGVWVLELPLAGVQIYAGIQLVQRRPRARALATTFAWLDIVLNVLGGIAQYALMSTMMSAMPSSPDAPPAAFFGMFRAFAAVGGAFSALISSIWPVFLLIWFSRATVRSLTDMWSAPEKQEAGPAST